MSERVRIYLTFGAWGLISGVLVKGHPLSIVLFVLGLGMYFLGKRDAERTQ